MRLAIRAAVRLNEREIRPITPVEDVVDLVGHLVAAWLDAERVTHEEPRAEATPGRTGVEGVVLRSSLGVYGTACGRGQC